MPSVAWPATTGKAAGFLHQVFMLSQSPSAPTLFDPIMDVTRHNNDMQLRTAKPTGAGHVRPRRDSCRPALDTLTGPWEFRRRPAYGRETAQTEQFMCGLRHLICINYVSSSTVQSAGSVRGRCQSVLVPPYPLVFR